MNYFKDSLKVLGPELSDVYLQVNGRNPKDAGSYFESVRGTMEKKFDQYFNGLDGSDADRIAPAYLQTYRTRWNQLPERPTNITEQSSILRTLYILAKLTHETNAILDTYNILDTRTKMVKGKLDPPSLEFGNAQWSEVGGLKVGGPLMQMAVNLAPRVGITGSFEIKKLMGLFIRQSKRRVAKTAQKVIAGFYTQKTIDHGALKSPPAVLSETMNKRALPVDKTILEIREGVIELASWDNSDYNRSMPYALLNDLLLDQDLDVFTMQHPEIALRDTLVTN